MLGLWVLIPHNLLLLMRRLVVVQTDALSYCLCKVWCDAFRISALVITVPAQVIRLLVKACSDCAVDASVSESLSLRKADVKTGRLPRCGNQLMPAYQWQLRCGVLRLVCATVVSKPWPGSPQSHVRYADVFGFKTRPAIALVNEYLIYSFSA